MTAACSVLLRSSGKLLPSKLPDRLRTVTSDSHRFWKRNSSLYKFNALCDPVERWSGAKKMRIQSIQVVLALLGCALTVPAWAQAPVPDSPAIEQQADAMVAKLTLQQKLEIIGGRDNMFIRAEPAAGFPSLKMSDGPEGVRTWGPDTAYAGGS